MLHRMETKRRKQSGERGEKLCEMLKVKFLPNALDFSS